MQLRTRSLGKGISIKFKRFLIHLLVASALVANAQQGPTFAWPIDSAAIGQEYARFNAVAANKFHTGIDMNPSGIYSYDQRRTATVKAAKAGKVHAIFGLSQVNGPTGWQPANNL